MPNNNRERLKQWLESGEVRLQPLTFPQRELWEAAPLPPEDASNNICAVIQLRGLLTPEGSEAALKKVVDRQEVFRLSFLPGKNQPVQMIRKSATTALRFRELPASQRSPGAIEELSAEIFRKPFDLVQGPLYRADVFRRAADDHLLVFAIHHSIADGWTLGVFVQDLFNAYLQGVRGLNTPLPPVPISYTEWGAAERLFWQPAEMERRAEYWKSNLADVPRLWSSQPTPSMTSGILERSVTEVPADIKAAICELARRNGVTLFSTLLAAFQIALSKWVGADDIVVGTPIANRNKQVVRETMGYCSGIVPLRGQIDRTRTFSGSVKEVHASAVESFANAMPFAELTKTLGEVASPGHNPIFQVRFALQNHPVPDVEMPGLSLKLRMRSTGTARFDLACEINEEGDRLSVEWLFRQNLFAMNDVKELAQIYRDMLASMCRAPKNITCKQLASLP